jgi:IS5 family transposase
MSIDLDAQGQMCLLQRCDRQTVITLPQGHRLLVLLEAIPWHDLMEKAKPILYDEQGISPNIGRGLKLRAHLGAYLLQTVHGWTDRWTEEMIRYYVPARVFCGFLESTGSLDHTRIEAFRNRFGKKGAQLITQDMLKVAQEYGFCGPEDVDMDTTVQEAGITYPTEMKLLDHLMKKAKRFHAKLKKAGRRGIRGIKKAAKAFAKDFTEFRFFQKTVVGKTKTIKRCVRLAQEVLAEMAESGSFIHSLPTKDQTDYQQLLALGPRLMKQILSWLETGRVASNKIVSLWKTAPKAIKKGKVGKPVEFGRKWLVNCYRGGYVLVDAPANVKIADQHCVKESLRIHQEVFSEPPESYATDRGMYSEANINRCRRAGVKKIGIQPKGRAKPIVSRRDHRRLKNRRAGIEPRLGHLKMRGLGRSRMKTDEGDIISGHRSALGYNLCHLVRDLKRQSVSRMVAN